jgi:molybdopterin-guanine dinucleotide biosynthesis protein B
MKVVAIVGSAQTGKTRLIKRLVVELKQRGHSVAVIKHCSQGFSFDLRGKDTWEFFEAGSDSVAAISPERSAIIQKVDDQSHVLEKVMDFLKDTNIVLMEGFKAEKQIKKIEVLRNEISEKLICPLEELCAVVADMEVKVNRPVYHPGQINEIASFIEREGSEWSTK